MRRIVGTTAAAVVLVGGIVGLASAVMGDPPSAISADPQVELGSGATNPEGEPLTDAEAEVLRQQVDPDRLRCEPRGCEIWRRDRASLSGVAAVGDLTVVLEGNQVVALDTATGEPRWTAPVGHLRSVTPDGEQVRSTSGQGTIAAARDGGGIYLVTGNEVSLIGLDADRVWSVQPEPDIDWHVEVLDDLLILHGPMRSGNNAHRIVALDPTTGSTVWSARGTSVLVVESDIVVVTTPERQLRAVDPSTGATMWERRPELGLWAGSVGPWIAMHGDGGLSLLDRADGRAVASLPGYLPQPMRQVGDLWLGLVISDAQSQAADAAEPRAPVALVALDATGDEAWRVPIDRDEATDCCALVIDDDGRIATIISATSLRRVDAVTGAVVDERPRPTDDDRAAASTFQTPEGPILRWSDGSLEVNTAEGGATIRGGELWLESVDPLVVGSPEHLVGVRLTPR